MNARRIEPGQTERSAEIEHWRRQQLLAAGFGSDLAAELAGSRLIDLHALLHLVDQGCPPKFAARILAPLDPTVAPDCSA
jgi:hypothetical protein